MQSKETYHGLVIAAISQHVISIERSRERCFSLVQSYAWPLTIVKNLSRLSKYTAKSVARIASSRTYTTRRYSSGERLLSIWLPYWIWSADYLSTLISEISYLTVEYHERLVKVMMFQGACWVKLSKWRACFDLEWIVGASMIEIVAEASHNQS